MVAVQCVRNALQLAIHVLHQHPIAYLAVLQEICQVVHVFANLVFMILELPTVSNVIRIVWNARLLQHNVHNVRQIRIERYKPENVLVWGDFMIAELFAFSVIKIVELALLILMFA